MLPTHCASCKRKFLLNNPYKCNKCKIFFCELCIRNFFESKPVCNNCFNPLSTEPSVDKFNEVCKKDLSESSNPTTSNQKPKLSFEAKPFKPNSLSLNTKPFILKKKEKRNNKERNPLLNQGSSNSNISQNDTVLEEMARNNIIKEYKETIARIDALLLSSESVLFSSSAREDIQETKARVDTLLASLERNEKKIAQNRSGEKEIAKKIYEVMLQIIKKLRNLIETNEKIEQISKRIAQIKKREEEEKKYQEMRNNALITKEKINPLCQFNVSHEFLASSKIVNTEDENKGNNPLTSTKNNQKTKKRKKNKKNNPLISTKERKNEDVEENERYNPLIGTGFNFENIIYGLNRISKSHRVPLNQISFYLETYEKNKDNPLLNKGIFKDLDNISENYKVSIEDIANKLNFHVNQIKKQKIVNAKLEISEMMNEMIILPIENRISKSSPNFCQPPSLLLNFNGSTTHSSSNSSFVSNQATLSSKLDISDCNSSNLNQDDLLTEKSKIREIWIVYENDISEFWISIMRNIISFLKKKLNSKFSLSLLEFKDLPWYEKSIHCNTVVLIISSINFFKRRYPQNLDEFNLDEFNIGFQNKKLLQSWEKNSFLLIHTIVSMIDKWEFIEFGYHYTNIDDFGNISHILSIDQNITTILDNVDKINICTFETLLNFFEYFEFLDADLQKI